MIYARITSLILMEIWSVIEKHKPDPITWEPTQLAVRELCEFILFKTLVIGLDYIQIICSKSQADTLNKIRSFYVLQGRTDPKKSAV